LVTARCHDVDRPVRQVLGALPALQSIAVVMAVDELHAWAGCVGPRNVDLDGGLILPAHFDRDALVGLARRGFSKPGFERGAELANDTRMAFGQIGRLAGVLLEVEERAVGELVAALARGPVAIGIGSHAGPLMEELPPRAGPTALLEELQQAPAV